MIFNQERRIEAFYSHVDVRAERDLNTWKEAIVSRWGGLDVIINNAGVATQGSIDEAPLEDWDWVVDINLMGVVRGCRSFVNLFKKQGYGHVVNIASISGLIFTPEMASYNATKAGVVALSETLRTELKPYNIRVTVVCPGFFKTNISETARSPNPHIKKALDKLFAKSKLDANDIARIVFKAVLANKFSRIKPCLT
ncbi:MAG: SDR family NAD(P)-dependent oxidoreductase [Proteobacteria bacterium]|nr:SDR family NAD(P)-dependent oxidoreductase [Pseudomonadota bacterium]